jgi:hypothetical protein
LIERDYLEELGVDGITILKWTKDIGLENISWVYLCRDKDYWHFL